jgi:ABC-type branched-subunit amino acid transport system substrate-binding protein
VKDPSCVMIIGNSNSQLTETTLNSILDYDGVKPTFILPIATADGIIAKSSSENYKSILRMVPDNQNQASIIKRFIFNKIGSKAKVALLVDEENQTYSNNLSKNLASEIIGEDGNVVLNQSYGNSQRLMGSYEILKRNELLPNVIVFVGVSSNGLLLIEELKALKIKTPVIFTDGCTVEQLMKKAGELLESDAYFLSAVSKSESGIEPTYEPIGKDAYALANKIIMSIDGAVTRESVAKFVAEHKDKITLDAAFAGGYEFDPEGNNKKMNFKVYTYKAGVLTEVIGIK